PCSPNAEAEPRKETPTCEELARRGRECAGGAWREPVGDGACHSPGGAAVVSLGRHPRNLPGRRPEPRRGDRSTGQPPSLSPRRGSRIPPLRIFFPEAGAPG